MLLTDSEIHIWILKNGTMVAASHPFSCSNITLATLHTTDHGSTHLQLLLQHYLLNSFPYHISSFPPPPHDPRPFITVSKDEIQEAQSSMLNISALARPLQHPIYGWADLFADGWGKVLHAVPLHVGTTWYWQSLLRA
jgi:hypothetical protein